MGRVGAAVVGGLVVKTDGVDFAILEPRWFAIAAFVALPGVAAFAVAYAIERLAPRAPWRCSRWAALLVLHALPAFLALVEEAGAAIMAVFATGLDVEYKADASPITRADRAADDILSEGLVRLTPAIPVL